MVNFINVLIYKTEGIKRKWDRYKNRILFKQTNCNINKIIIGPDVASNFKIQYPEKLLIGNGSVINGDCYINALGGVEIGIFCHIGKGLTIFSANHNYNSDLSIPYDNKNIEKPVIIKDFVWCGANVTIVPGVTIGEGVVIGASSVVTKDIPDYAVIGGNPAKVLKYRDIELFKKLKEQKKFY